ncbi:hypothetical protein ACFL14_02350 [Patescibacteria group bacterium]
MKQANNKTSSFYKLQQVVGGHHSKAKTKFEGSHNKAHKTLKKHGRTLDEIRTKGALAASTAAIASILATSPVVIAENSPADNPETPNKNQINIEEQKKDVPPVQTPDKPEIFAKKIRNIIGNKSKLSSEDEKALGQLISEQYGIKASAELDGNRLNVSYGMIGGEQHLPRFPGDTAASHYTENEDIYPTLSGITPGRGAWGYFAPSKGALTEDLKTKEQYYLVGQTFLAPGWGSRTKELYEWFKYRKMIAINTNTGQACVGALGDSGPATWTGKSFGGSPEVMIHIGYSTGSRKGPVVMFFIEDSENQVPLGKINAQAIDTSLNNK